MSQTVLDMACMLLPEPTNESNCLDMTFLLLPEPTNELDCSGYGWGDFT